VDEEFFSATRQKGERQKTTEMADVAVSEGM
jgi:hypothetical protein